MEMRIKKATVENGSHVVQKHAPVKSFKMRLTSFLRDEEFGTLSNRVRGIVIYKLSPYEQRAFAGFLKHGIPNTGRRIFQSLPLVLPFVLGTYFIYTEANKEYERLTRKNPADYENDV